MDSGAQYFTEFHSSLTLHEIRRMTYRTWDGTEGEELIFSFDSDAPAIPPEGLFSHVYPVFLMLRKRNARLRVPVFSGDLKLFFPNAADYYYLPAEDTVIHKSLAAFVDKDHRQKAVPSNCFVKKTGLFIPAGEREMKTGSSPSVHLFRLEYRSKLSWIEFDEALLTDRERSLSYLRSVLLLPGLLSKLSCQPSLTSPTMKVRIAPLLRNSRNP